MDFGKISPDKDRQGFLENCEIPGLSAYVHMAFNTVEMEHPTCNSEH